jgi:hypothetical protein
LFFARRPAAAFVLAIFVALLIPACAAKKPVPETLAAPEPDTASLAVAPPFESTQEYASLKFIYTLLAGNLDSLRVMLDEELRPQLTPEAMEYMRSQFKWFYDFVRGDFELFMSGPLDSSFFREYRLANESNKRYPLIVVRLEFPDSVSQVVIGAQVKNFLGGNEKRVTGEHSWTVGDKTYDLHSIIVATIDSGSIMAIQYYEDDTATVNQEFVSQRALPLIREALARGFRDSALAVNEGKPMTDDIGVVFIRRDPRGGMVHIKVGFRPEDFGGYPETGKRAEKPKATKAKK